MLQYNTIIHENFPNHIQKIGTFCSGQFTKKIITKCQLIDRIFCNFFHNNIPQEYSKNYEFNKIIKNFEYCNQEIFDACHQKFINNEINIEKLKNDAIQIIKNNTNINEKWIKWLIRSNEFMKNGFDIQIDNALFEFCDNITQNSLTLKNFASIDRLRAHNTCDQLFLLHESKNTYDGRIMIITKPNNYVFTCDEIGEIININCDYQCDSSSDDSNGSNGSNGSNDSNDRDDTNSN